jgi:hypothetical protein
MMLSTKLLFFMNVFIVFHSALASPKIRTTVLSTIFTASGGFGSEANSFKLAELIPETDFLASSKIGFTYAS